MMSLMRSAKHRRNRIGPRTDPCGTRRVILREWNWSLCSEHVVVDAVSKYEENPSRTTAHISVSFMADLSVGLYSVSSADCSSQHRNMVTSRCLECESLLCCNSTDANNRHVNRRALVAAEAASSWLSFHTVHEQYVISSVGSVSILAVYHIKGPRVAALSASGKPALTPSTSRAVQLVQLL